MSEQDRAQVEREEDEAVSAARQSWLRWWRTLPREYRRAVRRGKVRRPFGRERTERAAAEYMYRFRTGEV